MAQFRRVVERLGEALLLVLILIMTLACLGQVIWRYLFNDPLIWSEELSRFLFIWISYLGAWMAWRYRRHIALDAVLLVRSNGLRRASATLVEILVLVFCLYTAWGSIGLLALSKDQPSAVLQLPMMWVYLSYPVMALLISLDIIAEWIHAGPGAGRPQAIEGN